MNTRRFRIWFLCTLVVVGMLPMPAAVAGGGSGCCSSPASDAEPAAIAAPVASCCPGTTADDPDACSEPAADADADAEAHRGCGDCNDCGTRACRCGQCGCHPPSVLPAVRPPSMTIAPIVPAASIRVVERHCRPLADAGSLLRPPRG